MADLLAVLIHEARAELHGAQHNGLGYEVIKGRCHQQQLSLTGHSHPTACSNTDMLLDLGLLLHSKGWGNMGGGGTDGGPFRVLGGPLAMTPGLMTLGYFHRLALGSGRKEG